MKNVLVASYKHTPYRIIKESLPSGYTVDTAQNKSMCLEMFHKKRYDLLFIDLKLLLEHHSETGFKSALKPFRHIYPTAAVIIMTPNEQIRQAVMAVKAGVKDYLTYPVTHAEVKLLAENIQESLIVQSEINYLRDRFWNREIVDLIQTRSPLMKRVYEKVKSVAVTKSTVLITGETGTGKSVLANLIHQHSSRKDNPFISIHCGAIPDTLVESELFGHEKGAFTGAIKRKLGKFEIAESGTIFLDEIGTVTPSAQVKLLQVLQDGTFQRVGGEETIHADVRVISATNTNLDEMCESGKFRNDLYYRLNVFPIDIPPLRDRIEDITIIADSFLKKLNKFNLKEIYDIHPEVLEALIRYPWPGNIREMENLIERAYILEQSDILTPESFPREFTESEKLTPSLHVDHSITLGVYRKKAVENIEKTYLEYMLSFNKGKINDTASSSGITTRQLHKLMKKHGIRKEDFKEKNYKYRLKTG
ncbi:MAG: sigma-54 dependent transcriptional regulator [Desulfobacterales bacterium]|nr:sigma-54 dependent transcriptional regulator [Desulfobacterales bacterium]